MALNLPGMFNALGAVSARRPPEDAPAATAEPEAREQPQSDNELLALIDRRFAAARQGKEPQLRRWATCLAFYVGEQHRVWDRQARRLVDDKRIASYKIQHVDNQIPGIVEVAASKFQRARQLPKALPNTGEPEDEAGAQAGTQVLEHWWRVGGMEVKELEADTIRILFGAAFYHDYWDPTKQATVPVPVGMRQDPETGQVVPITEARKAPVGDVCVEALTVFDVFPDPSAERFDECGWVIVARRKPVYWVEETFGKKVRPEATAVEDVLTSLLPGAQVAASATDGDGSVLLKVYYERPCRKYPQGRMAMTAGGEVLYRADSLPMPHGEIPVTMVPYRLVPKRLWPMGLIECVIGLQRELNRGGGYIAEILRMHAWPKWLAKKGSVDAKAITNAPGEVIEYTDQPPSIAPPPPVPAWIVQYPEAQRAGIRILAGQHEVTNGMLPSNVSSGVAISQLAEADNQRLGAAQLLGKYALEQVSRRVLSTITVRYREPRLIRTFGRDKSAQITALTGADIGDRDVLVEIGEGVSNTPAARRQRFLDYKQNGLFDLPMPLQKAFLHELEEEWLIEAIERAGPEMEMLGLDDGMGGGVGAELEGML